MTKRKKITLVIIIILLIGIFAGSFYLYTVLNTVLNKSLDKEKLGTNENLDNTVVNIAMFGIDGREDEDVEGDRTDVIMIGTLDTKTNAVKVTSVMRDTFTKICINPEGENVRVYAGDQDGLEWELSDYNSIYAQADTNDLNPDQDELEVTEEGQEVIENTQTGERVTINYENRKDVAEYNKINAAFDEGGVESSIFTLNQNFDLNIEDYITVDFTCLMEVVDALGGIQLDIANEDILYWTNQYLMESNAFGNRNDPDLEHTGVQTVTGAQALAFARNRYTDSDYGRTMRQREVVQAIFDKAKQMNAVQAIDLLNRIYPYIQTSLSLGEITDYATRILNTQDITFEDYRIPTNKYGSSGFIDSIWYLFPDTLIDNNTLLHKFIYGENNPYVPSSTVKQINQVIEDIVTYDAYDVTLEAGGSAQETITEQEIVTENGQTVESPTTQEELNQ